MTCVAVCAVIGLIHADIHFLGSVLSELSIFVKSNQAHAAAYPFFLNNNHPCVLSGIMERADANYSIYDRSDDVRDQQYNTCCVAFQEAGFMGSCNNVSNFPV